MQASIDNGEFIENAEFSGNMYGTSKAAVQDVQAKNLICILDIDMQGVRNIKRTDLNPIYISIQPPSMATLIFSPDCPVPIAEKRLRDRKTESEESLQKRLHAAKVEMEFSKEPGVFDVIIVNDSLEDAYGQLKQALLELCVAHLDGDVPLSPGPRSAGLRAAGREKTAGQVLLEATEEAAPLPRCHDRPPHVQQHGLSHCGPANLPLQHGDLTRLFSDDVGGAVGLTFFWNIVLQVFKGQNTISLFQNLRFLLSEHMLIVIFIIRFKDDSLLIVQVVAFLSSWCEDI
ncbi:hypothetical protein INR49_010628 [Caranx melampygus]|nr:hypothetical protein INR49_010628 [Caranx melampygus]